MFVNPNIAYWEEQNQLTDRQVFHCADRMRTFASGDVIDLGAGIGVLTDFFG